MKILIYALNYAPELTGVGKFTGETAAWLMSRGHEVQVVTAPPYYPEWRIHPNYRRLLYQVEGSSAKTLPKVYRCPLWVPGRKPGGIARLLHLSSFAVSSLPVMILKAFWKPEIVFTVQPTLFAAPMALFVAALSGSASWLHVQDFEVDAAFEFNFLPKDGSIYIVAKGLEKFFTRCFSRVSTISSKMEERIKASLNVRSDVLLFPNWGDTSLIRPAPPETVNSFRQVYGLEAKFIFLYSGNMGTKQGLDILVPLVEFFSSNSKVHFLFCGDGVCRAQLDKQVGHRANVTLLPLQRKDRFNELLNAADIHLLPQKRCAAELVMPSKLNELLASGRPVIATADEGTEVARVVNRCGLVVPPEDANALCAAAVRMIEDAALRASLGVAAREYAVKHLSKDRILEQFELDLMSLVKSSAKSEEVQLARSYWS